MKAFQLKDLLLSIKKIKSTLLIGLMFVALLSSEAFGKATCGTPKLKYKWGALVDSLKRSGADTIIVYADLCEHCVDDAEEKVYINYIMDHTSYMIVLVGKNKEYVRAESKSNRIFLEIFNQHKVEIVNSLTSKELLLDSVKTDKGYIIKEPFSHGSKKLFYVMEKENVWCKEYCCGLSLNAYYWRKYPELWLLASAFNNLGK